MAYEYKSLEQADSFRLMKLFPDDDLQANLHCELADSRLSCGPDFEALSYTWDQDASVTLYMSSGNLQITQNLASALRHFRLSSRPRILWVDAVCINQASIPERNQQVGLMSRIYRHAEQVLCWIGESNDKSEVALGYIQHMARSCTRYGLGEVNANMWLKVPVLDSSEEEARDIIQDARTNYMSSIYGRRWFSRLWVVQEAALAKEAILCLGKHEMRWKIFATAMLILVAAMEKAGPWAGASQLAHSDVEAFLHSWNIVRTRAKHRFLTSPNVIVESSHTGFAMVITRLMLHNCSDDHDRIYAVLGLNPSTSPIEVVYDYSLPVAKLYTDFAAAHLRRREIEILYDAGLVRRSEDKAPLDNPKLPSWAPEYRRAYCSQWATPYPWEQEHYSTALELPPTIEVEASGSAILIRGAILDKIKFAFNFPTAPGMPLHNFGTIRELVTMCVREFHDINPDGYPTAEESSMVLARLFLLDGLLNSTRRFLPNQTKEIMLEYWLAYDKHCLGEAGEVLLKVREADLRIGNMSQKDKEARETGTEFWEFEFPKSLSLEARKGWVFHQCLQHILGKCPIASMYGGVLGMVPAGVRAGDVIAIFEGARMPYVLREAEDKSAYQLIGACYIHGVMEGGVVTADWYEEAQCMMRLI